MSDLVPSLLPPNAGAIARALEQGAVRASAIEAAIAGLWNPWTCPLAVLPWLAWAFAVNVWDSAWTEARKRQVVASSLAVHRRKGTRRALTQALAAVDHPTRVVEWWEETPPADPFTFRVEVHAGAGVDAADVRAIGAVIDSAKNLRSWLSALTIAATSLAGLAVGAVGRAHLRVRIPAAA